MPKSDKRQNNNKDENSTLKKVIMIIIIIIIILLLITSCSSIFFGKVGNFFDGTSDYDIEDGNNTLEKIYNKELKFIKSDGETLLDETYKIEFITSNLDTDDYKCSTSDAKIATCVVKDNYIIVYPKREGKVTITVSTKLNGKEYIGTHYLTITSPKRNIQLSSETGTINLMEYDTLEIPYNLNNLAGNVKVISSDEKIATATAKNGILTIVGHKPGKVIITLTVEYQGQKYTTTYDLTVTNNKNIKPNGTGNKPGNSNNGGGSSKPGGNGGSGNQGGNSTDPNPPSKSDIKTLDYIIPSIGNLSPAFNKNETKYTIEDIPTGVNNIKLDIKPTSSKAKVYYYVNNSSVPNLDFNNVNLNPNGDTPIKIVVEAEDGSTKAYYITAKHKDAPTLSSIATLNNLTITPGGETINPTFTSNETKYTATVNNDVSQVTITAPPTDSKATVYINGSTTNNVVNLNVGKNEVEIKVIAEDGKTEKIYKLDITRKEPGATKSDVNTLDSIKVTDGTQNFPLTPNFLPTTDKYSTKVNHNTASIGLIIKRTDGSSTIKYQYKDGTEITDINNITLKEGENIIQAIVTSESGKVNPKPYEITITRPKRTIVLDKSITEIAIDEASVGNATSDIMFSIFEDGILVDNYAKNDIAVDLIDENGNKFKGKVEITVGKNGTSSKISITPTIDDVNKKFKLTATYLGTKVDTINELVIKTTMKYYIKPNNDGPYNFNINSTTKNNIIVNTNIFNNGNISYENTPNGIKLYNEKGYIYVTSSDPNIIKIAFNKEDNKDPKSYIAFLTEAINIGYADITITGSVYNEEIEPVTIKVQVSEKYSVTINANGGFFDAFTDKYKILLDKDTTINLADYKAFKIDKKEEENCKYYELDSYNTMADGSGKTYQLTDIIEGNNITEDLTLYAIYKETSKVINVEKEGIMYLTEVDLFRNEEYYKKYKKDKIIYPGANGSHTAYIKNNTKHTLKINSINITEYTTCIDEGCINMGYVIKYTKRSDDTWKYFYGGTNNKFDVLNRDNESSRANNGVRTENSITLPNNTSSSKESIELTPGEEVAISILWKWVEIDTASDKLDTKIGNITSDQDYSIMVGFKYTTKDSYCENGN